MLQPDAFCELTMQQNATAAGAPPEPLAGFKGLEAGRGEEESSTSAQGRR